MQRSLSQNKTNVRFSWADSGVKVFPTLVPRLLTELFLHPRRRTPRVAGAGAGTAIDSVRVGGKQVVVRASGRGPQVALVHGWQGHVGQFAKLRSALLRAGFTVVTFDMPAHGESNGFSTNIGEFITTISHVAHNVGPLHGIVAHSLGATATALALSKGVQTSSAVLISPAISFDFALDVFTKAFHLGSKARERLACGVEERARMTRKEVDLLGLAAPSCPVRIIHDQGDRRAPVGYSSQLASRWPDAELAITRGLGHGRILDDTEVTQGIVDFLRAAPRQSSAFEASLGALPSVGL